MQTAGNVATYPQCSEVKNTHYPCALCILRFALQFSLSLGALLSMCFIARFLFFYTNKPTAVIESQGSEANLPGSKPQLCLSQAVWPLLRFPHLHIENVSGICFRMLGGSNERVKHLESRLAHS